MRNTKQANKQTRVTDLLEGGNSMVDREVTKFFEEVTHELRLRDRKEWGKE